MKTLRKIQMNQDEENAKQAFKFHEPHFFVFSEVYSQKSIVMAPMARLGEDPKVVWNISRKTHMDALVYRQDMMHAVASKCYEPRSSFYAVRHPYQINFPGTPDGKLSNKAEKP